MAGIKLDPTWQLPLKPVFESEGMRSLRLFLEQERAQGQTIYPKMANVFAALDATPLDQVKVVILGQDPYPGVNQAHGLSFSVLPGVPVPRSLANIYLELKQELGITPVKHGYLMPWAKQGVLLLNAVLTVRANQINSHKGKGWEAFTDAVIDLVSAQAQPSVFMLWGRQAQEKGARVDTRKHLVLRTSHPSPMSASQGFLGCGHFVAANEFLLKHNRRAIDWRLPDRITESADE